MHFLLTPVGSSGDVHPYVGLGKRLRSHGHDVSLIAGEPHRATVEGAGLVFDSIYDRERYEAATLDPDLWHPRRSLAVVARILLEALDAYWGAIEKHYVPGRTFLVGHPLAFATRSFEEKHGAPAATLHLAPSSLRTTYDVPVFAPALAIAGWPRLLKRAFFALIDRTQIDPLFAPGFNRWRAGRGLSPVRFVFRDWMNSPQRVVALFPEWFGPRQPDWPVELRHASFPLWDDPGRGALEPALEAFLAAGSPPVVATPGSANRQGSAFFAAVTSALARLGRRGLFLTGFPEQLPKELPPTILACRYAPLSSVLPRSAALIHHGGIGTEAQAFAAGVPQLVMPMAFDQPDNAARAVRLGVAQSLLPERFTADGVERALGRLLSEPAVAAAAARRRDALREVDGLALTCDLLERDAERTLKTPGS